MRARSTSERLVAGLAAGADACTPSVSVSMSESGATPVVAIPEGDLGLRGAEGELDLLERQRYAHLRSQISGEPWEPLRIGRFTLLGRLGEGGMGTVYAAYDDELDRKVALKFLRRGLQHDEAATQRLLREAQALARLSHPHLVTVFDVGRFEDEVYLAMEFVDGETMRVWAAEGQPWRQVLRHWLDIGEGIAAVHRAGLVHRDVKPDNVIIGRDGRARLVDFGLVRSTTDSRSPSASHNDGDVENAEPTVPVEQEGSSFAVEVTEPHAIVGTPAYMAPELKLGETAGPSVDQYSLCVAVFETLHGQRPHRVASQRRAMVKPRKVPAAIWRVLDRGLAEAPEERFESVEALVAALRRAAGLNRRRAIGAAGVIGVAAGAGLVLALVRVTAPAPCAAASRDLDEVWGEAQRDRLAQALTEGSHAVPDATSRELVTRLDGYATRFLAAREDVCKATRVDGLQSEALFGARMHCLDRARGSFAAMLEVASDPTERKQGGFAEAVAELPDPDRCRTYRDEGGWARGTKAAESEKLYAQLAHLRAEFAVRGAVDIENVTRTLLVQAEASGDRSLWAEVEAFIGNALRRADDPRARAYLRRAANVAESVGYDELKLRVWIDLALLAIDLDLDAEAARVEVDRARATLARIGQPNRFQQATLAEIEGLLAALAGESDLALRAFESSIALWIREGDLMAAYQANAWRDLGNFLSGRGRYEQAKDAFERAAELEAVWTGVRVDVVNHANVPGKAEFYMGLALMEESDLVGAEAELVRALELCRAAFGEDSVPSARIHVALADLAARDGRIELVEAHGHAADRAYRRWLGPDHPARNSSLSAVGSAAFHRGDVAKAVEAFGEALRLAHSVMTPESILLALARSNYGEALVLASRYDEAATVLQASLQMMEKLESGDLLAFPLLGLAELRFVQGANDEALALAERALALREARADDPLELARTRWLLARIEARRGHRERALTLARSASEGFASFGPSFARHVGEIDAWTPN